MRSNVTVENAVPVAHAWHTLSKHGHLRGDDISAPCFTAKTPLAPSLYFPSLTFEELKLCSVPIYIKRTGAANYSQPLKSELMDIREESAVPLERKIDVAREHAMSPRTEKEQV